MKNALIVSFTIFGILLVGAGFARLDQNGWCKGFSGWMGSSLGQLADPYEWHMTDPYKGHLGGPFLGYEVGSYPAHGKGFYAGRMGGPSPTRMAALQEGSYRTFECPR